MKTIFLFLVLISGILGMAFNCCSETPKYWNISSFEVEFLDNQYAPIPSSGPVTSDSLVLRLHFEPEYLSQQFFNPFINQAYATSCPDPGELGMKDKLIHINLTSNADFNQFPPGISMAPIIRIQNLLLEDWVAKEQYNIFHLDLYWDLILFQKPNSNSNKHSFTLSLTFESGRTESLELPPIQWD